MKMSLRNYFYRVVDWLAFQISPAARDALADAIDYETDATRINNERQVYLFRQEQFEKREQALRTQIHTLEKQLAETAEKRDSAERRTKEFSTRSNQFYEALRVLPEVLIANSNASTPTHPRIVTYHDSIIQSPIGGAGESFSALISNGQHYKFGQLRRIRDRIEIEGKIYSVREIEPIREVDGLYQIHLRAMGEKERFIERAHDRSYTFLERLRQGLSRKKIQTDY